MSVQDHQLRAQQAAMRVGPVYLTTFLISIAFTAPLSLLSLLVQNPVIRWQEAAKEFLQAGNPVLPELSSRLLLCMGLSMLLSLLVQVVNVGWISISLRAIRGLPYHWRELPSFFPKIGKIFLLTIFYEGACLLATLLFVVPGILLFYRWRLSFWLLAEHPDYGPIQCLRESARLMQGERMTLFRLDLSMLLPYGISLVVFFLTSGVIQLWRQPTMAITYGVFYNAMVQWQEVENHDEA